ncbi:MAG: hypothetical protein U1D00_19385 [Mycobacterium sp.]|nr:hypothetical protein [Mycobacterium sp.]
MTATTADTSVLIAGAGPVGLTAALEPLNADALVSGLRTTFA